MVEWNILNERGKCYSEEIWKGFLRLIVVDKTIAEGRIIEESNRKINPGRREE